MPDDGVRERTGVMGWQRGYVAVRESSDVITVGVSDGISVCETPITIAAASRLASQLHRLVRRARERENA